MSRAASGRLRQHHAVVDVHDHGPLQPMAPGEAFTPLLRPLHKERAEGPWCEPRAVYCHCCLVAGSGGQPLDNGTQGLLQGCLVEPTEQAVDGGLVGHTPPLQGRAPCGVFSPSDVGFTRGPLLITQQAQNGQ
jgi:hypothetical protein